MAANVIVLPRPVAISMATRLVSGVMAAQAAVMAWRWYGRRMLI
jgi:hypothetical protein